MILILDPTSGRESNSLERDLDYGFSLDLGLLEWGYLLYWSQNSIAICVISL